MLRAAAARVIACCSLLVLLTVTIAPASAEVRLHVADTCRIQITGEITQADADAVTRMNCPAGKFTSAKLMDSPGGDVHAAMAIGRWLRVRNAWVIVDGPCYSSCALVYIGGVRRENGGGIGLHRPFLAGAPRPASEVRAAVASMLADVGAYVSDMGVTPDFTNVMVNTPPEGMRMFDEEEITSLVPEFDLVYDELRTASWARQRGLTTAEYRRRWAEVERLCFQLEDESESSDCSDATLWGLSVSLYKQRKVAAAERCPDPRLLMSDQEVAAWQASARQFADHPKAVAHQSCIIAVMQGR